MPENEVQDAPAPSESEPTSAPAVSIDAELPLQLEAILLSVDRAMPASKLAELTTAENSKAVHAAIAELNVVYEKSGEVLRALMERGMVKIAGRAEEIGRPILYGTTRKFLEVFGLSSLSDLPKPEQFGAPPQMNPAEPAEAS